MAGCNVPMPINNNKFYNGKLIVKPTVVIWMMMVVDATGLALVPWDRLAVLIVIGVTWFFKFFIVGELARICDRF
ncbi:unnamed protein product [Nippostrongylus brasiliensis]|uniref:Ion_trans domain-containing protein n=1 Tax=Nippostrongylus brasiliensis TaxID=27835 RepID=A0A0N4YHY9_NIPBR|nr:unnamed protein product [Nippostrongylus brasiliensis]